MYLRSEARRVLWRNAGYAPQYKGEHYRHPAIKLKPKMDLATNGPCYGNWRIRITRAPVLLILIVRVLVGSARKQDAVSRHQARPQEQLER